MTVDFIGIGTVKSASTWLFTCLLEHPQVCGSVKKEIGFFNDPYLFKNGVSWYMNHFSHRQPSQICGEFTPSYIESIDAAQRIKNLFPHVKIIAIFRNPIDKLYSFYWFNKLNGIGSLSAFDRFEDILDPALGIIDMACNGKNIANYYQLFPREQIFSVLYDDIKENPEQVLRELYSFLGIDTAFVAPSTYKRAVNQTQEAVVQFSWLHKTMFKLFWNIKKIRWMYRLLKKINTQQIIQTVSNFTITKNTSKGEGFRKPSMDGATRKRLQDYFRADTQLLGDILRRDLSEWV